MGIRKENTLISVLLARVCVCPSTQTGTENCRKRRKLDGTRVQNSSRKNTVPVAVIPSRSSDIQAVGGRETVTDVCSDRSNGPQRSGLFPAVTQAARGTTCALSSQRGSPVTTFTPREAISCRLSRAGPGAGTAQ